MLVHVVGWVIYIKETLTCRVDYFPGWLVKIRSCQTLAKMEFKQAKLKNNTSPKLVIGFTVSKTSSIFFFFFNSAGSTLLYTAISLYHNTDTKSTLQNIQRTV